MRDLDTFRQRLHTYRRAALDNQDRWLTQKALAKEVGLDPTELSNRLNGTKRARLTCENVRSIVRVLAQYHGITTRAQATELLDLMGCRHFSPADWGAPPLNMLAPDAPHEDTRSVPSAAASSQPPHNLPYPLTSFVGREQEIVAVTDLLRKARLVTLTGTGGSGKTRLALEVARRMLERLNDGVWFVDLAPITDLALVIPAIAQALGVKEGSPEPLIERTKAYLRNKHLLLLLDNFEQVVRAAPRITDLLKAAPRLIVLATSRVTLRLYGEHVFPLAPLPVPDSDTALATLAGSAAIRLFVDRAQAAKPDFVLAPADAPAVTQLCAYVDGLPLAIELAAARTDRFTPHALLTSFSGRLALGSDGPQDVPPRHRTLRATIAWSYDLLDPAEQALFARLGVFVGGCTAEAAEAVCGDGAWLLSDTASAPPSHSIQNPKSKTQNLLASLLDKNLLRQTAGADGQPRVGMLETIREYASERLAASGEADMLRQRHAEYFLTLAEMAEPTLMSIQQRTWFDRLQADQDNLRAALQWSLDQEQGEMGLRLAGALWQFWDLRGDWSEGRRWLDAVLRQNSLLPPSARAKMLKAAVLHGAGTLARQQGDLEKAKELHEESLLLYQELGDKRGVASSLSSLGRASSIARGKELLEASLRLYQELDDKHGVCEALIHLGSHLLNYFPHDSAYAKALIDESLVLARQFGDPALIACSYGNLAFAAMLQGDYQGATRLYEQSLALYEELDDKQHISWVLYDLGEVAVRQGNYEQAQEFYTESLQQYCQWEDKIGITFCLEGLVKAAMAERKFEWAVKLFVVAKAQRDAISHPLGAYEGPLYEQWEAATRVQLDQAVWEAAWAEGLAMPLDQAVAYAVGGEASI